MAGRKTNKPSAAGKTNRPPRVLLTGADGMLGSYLARELLARDYAVRAFVLPNSASPTLDGLPLEIVRGDLTRAPQIAQAVKGCRYVIHSAAIINLRAPKELVWKVNLDGTRHVLEACRAAKVKRLVYVGSASSFQFGPRENPPVECGGFPDNYRGVPYMESKFQATIMVRDFARRTGLEAVSVAPTFLVGGFNYLPGSSSLVRGLVDGTLRVASPGGRCFAYARDVATAIVNALRLGRPGECYLLGGENLDYREFLTKVARVAGKRPPLLTVPYAGIRLLGWGADLLEATTRRKLEINGLIARLSLSYAYYSSAKAIRELDMPQTPIETAIRDSIRGLVEYGYLPRGCDAHLAQ